MKICWCVIPVCVAGFLEAVNLPGQIILSRDENFGQPFYRTALANNTLYLKTCFRKCAKEKI